MGKEYPMDKFQNGIAVALMFLGLAVFLYLNPDYFGVKKASRLLGIIMAIAGVMGLGIELNRLSSKKPLGLDNLGIGLGLGAFWALIHFNWSYWWVNILIFPILGFAMYGILHGIISATYVLATSANRAVLLRIPITLAQVAGLALAVLQIVQLVNNP